MIPLTTARSGSCTISTELSQFAAAATRFNRTITESTENELRNIRLEKGDAMGCFPPCVHRRFDRGSKLIW